MKKIIYIFLTCLFAKVASAQNGIIQGHVFEENTPVEFVNVLLFAQNDSVKPVKSNVTDSTVFFILENVPIDNYFKFWFSTKKCYVIKVIWG